MSEIAEFIAAAKQSENVDASLSQIRSILAEVGTALAVLERRVAKLERKLTFLKELEQ